MEHETALIILGSGGVSGAVNLLLTQFRSLFLDRKKRALQALLLAEHLENFAFGCAGNAFTTYGIVEEGRSGVMLSSVPTFPPFSDKLDWQALDVELVASARAVETHTQNAQSQTESAFGKSELHGFRWSFAETLRIGAEALDVAARIRSENGLRPLMIPPPRWDWRIFLKGELEKLAHRLEQIAQQLHPEGSCQSSVARPA